MSATFMTRDGMRRVQVVRMEGEPEKFIVEKHGGLMTDRRMKKGWYVITETSSMDVVSMHVRLDQLMEVAS